VGLGLGGVHVAFSLFIEFVPTNDRGRYAVLMQGFWTIGAILEAGLAWAILPTLGWRYLLGFSAIPLVILLFFYPLLSESPRYLALKGKTVKAERVLSRISRLNGKELPAGKLVTPDAPFRAVERKGGEYHLKKIFHGMANGILE